jgi:prepilin-type N-terminal cleavage/methylation domain-containing protein
MKNHKFKKAYSLLELSIVIVIISILIAGALSASTSSINSSRIKNTKDRMEGIYKAMGIFLTSNNRLPCPASLIAVKTVHTNYGIEVDGNGGCDNESGVFKSTVSGFDDIVYGMVPAKTLGLSIDMAEDAFGSKIIYIVDKNFTNALNLTTVPDFMASNFSVSAHAAIVTIHEKPSAITHVVTNDAIMALISFGPNKLGAFNANSDALNDIGAGDELDNHIPSIASLGPPSTANFDNIIVKSSANSDSFDDVVLFKRRDDLVEDFKAMFLIPCEVSAGDISTFGFPSATYYDATIHATLSTCGDGTLFSKRCETYGQLVDVVSICADGT